MAIDLEVIRGQIGTALATIDGLRAFDFPPLSAQPPFAFPDMPEAISYDSTLARGCDRMEIKVYLGVSANVDRTSATALSEYAAASGDSSIKAAIEAGGVGSSTRVTRCEFTTITLAEVDYAGAIFTLDVLA